MIRSALFALAAGLTFTATPAAAATFEGVFAVRAKGITAGEFTLRSTIEGNGRYQAQAERRASGVVRGLVGAKQDYRYAATGRIVDGLPTPSTYEHSGGRRGRRVWVDFAADGSSTTRAEPEMSMGDPPATPAQRKGAVDQLSALVALLALPEGREPCRGTLPVLMDGRARFDFVLRPDGVQAVRTEGYRGEAVRCRVDFKPLAGFGDPQEAATLTFLLARIDGVMAPVRIQMPTDDAGVVTLEARSLRVTR